MNFICLFEVEINKRFQLYERCNQTYFNQVENKNQEFQCSFECEHIQCQQGYRNDGKQCGRHCSLLLFEINRLFVVNYEFTDRCAHDVDICDRASPGAVCDVNENECTCGKGSYRDDDENMCGKMFFLKNIFEDFFFGFEVKAVGESCVKDSQCGQLGSCINDQCQCATDSDVTELDDKDSFGRFIKRCIKSKRIL